MGTMDLHAIDANSTVRIEPERKLSPEEFFEFCQANEDWRIEQTAEGQIEIMPPAAPDASDKNSEITYQLRRWAKRDRRGVAFDATAGFILPNGAMRSPDGSWIRRERYDALPAEEKNRFPHICPDFVIELASPSDSLPRLKRKMHEWIDNGAQLGWLIDPRSRIACVYRPGREPEMLIEPQELRGEGPVNGFVLDLEDVWGGSN